MKIKICGLRTVSDVETAVDAGASAIGFVFARSPRQISLEEAVPLLCAVPPSVLKVAVFRRPDAGLLAAVLAAGVDVIQADADWESGGLMVPFLPALSDGPDLAARVAATPGVCLVDGPRGGGAGVLPDLTRVASVAATRRVVLAGGLTPENVSDAIARVRPWGVDVSSGVEASRGRKDPERIRAFIDAARTGRR
jgi:phosphoribosylanthranilate isomerase